MRLLILSTLLIFISACSSATSEPTSSQTLLTEVKPVSSATVATREPDQESKPSATSTVEPIFTVTPPLEASETPTGTAIDLVEPVIFFQIEGGIAGLMQNWMIYPDGSISGEQGVDCQVEPESVANILELAEENGFFMMSFVKTPNVCCDFFTFDLTIRTADLENSVRVSDGDPKMPDELRELILAVQQMLFDCIA